MSISADTLRNHLHDPAVFCCRRQKGTVIGPGDLEDPSLFEEMLASGLITLSPDGLTIERALGQTLTKDCEALTAILPEMLAGMPGTAGMAASAPIPPAPPFAPLPPAPSFAPLPIPPMPGSMIHIEIGKLENLKLDLPMGAFPFPGMMPPPPPPCPMPGPEAYTPAAYPTSPEPKPMEDRVLRTLTKKFFNVRDVVIGQTTSFADGTLTLDRALETEAMKASPLVKSLTMDVIRPDQRHVFTQTIMDVCPVSTKAQGKLGEGVSFVLDGVVFMLTGIDEAGVQIHEFGSSEGFLDEKMAFGRPGCADAGDIIVRVHVMLARNTGMERRGPFAAHAAQDVIIQAIRDMLKLTVEPVAHEEICRDVRKAGRPRVVLIKEIMGQGAMHDNVLCPIEPAGIQGGQKNVDLGNVPVMMTPNQVRDGAIHALTCIGPATKEMTRHYFREPLVEGLAEDQELDLIGVIFVGSPQVNDEKMYVSQRLGTLVETLDVQGAIVTTEGFGNNHIDFASHIEQVGMRGIPVVGVSFCAYQGQLVVGNPYMDAMIELNKDGAGFENEIAGCSSLTPDDARRAILMLKTKMAGIPLLPSAPAWDPAVIKRNQQIADGV